MLCLFVCAWCLCCCLASLVSFVGVLLVVTLWFESFVSEFGLCLWIRYDCSFVVAIDVAHCCGCVLICLVFVLLCWFVALCMVDVVWCVVVGCCFVVLRLCGALCVCVVVCVFLVWCVCLFVACVVGVVCALWFV